MKFTAGISHKRLNALFFIGAFLVLAGIIWFVRASGSSSSIEAEQQKPLSNARTFQQSSASEGAAVRFGTRKALGAAVTSSQLADTNFSAILQLYHYAVLTPIYEMKFATIEPKQNQFDFSGSDKIVEFSRVHSMNVHGHTLVWHQNLPQWLIGQSWTKQQVRDILTNHIATVMGHYSGKNVISWDVVNEALNDDGSLRTDIWLNSLGPGYIDQAFILAHQADQTTKLYYNDYNIEPTNTKSNALYAMVSDMKRRGIPIDGIGFQMHKSISSNLNINDFAQNLQRFTDLGLEVAISEMDVSVGTNQPTSEQVAAQTALYNNIASVCSTNPRCVRFGTWGISDKYPQITLPNGLFDAALPFDNTLKPKPSVEAIEDIF